MRSCYDSSSVWKKTHNTWTYTEAEQWQAFLKWAYAECIMHKLRHSKSIDQGTSQTTTANQDLISPIHVASVKNSEKNTAAKFTP